MTETSNNGDIKVPYNYFYKPRVENKSMYFVVPDKTLTLLMHKIQHNKLIVYFSKLHNSDTIITKNMLYFYSYAGVVFYYSSLTIYYTKLIYFITAAI